MHFLCHSVMTSPNHQLPCAVSPVSSVHDLTQISGMRFWQQFLVWRTWLSATDISTRVARQPSGQRAGLTIARSGFQSRWPQAVAQQPWAQVNSTLHPFGVGKSSTGYGWEGIRQVCATLLGARHVPERLCGGACLQRGTITSVRPLPFTFLQWPGCSLTIIIITIIIIIITTTIFIVLSSQQSHCESSLGSRDEYRCYFSQTPRQRHTVHINSDSLSQQRKGNFAESKSHN